jgi:hypothetical protein
MAAQTKLDPLRDFLDAVVTRIEALEAKVGVTPSVTTSQSLSGSSSHGAPAMQKSPSARHIGGGECVFLFVRSLIC